MGKKKKTPEASTRIPCCFISIVGMQVFGTINPLLAVLAEDFQPSCVHLLATPEILEEGTGLSHIQEFCKKRGLSCETHSIAKISDFTSDNAAPAVALSLAQIHAEQNERCIFNLNGGTNALIASTISHLLSQTPYIIQVTDTAAVLTDTENGTSKGCRSFESLSAREILSLQGVPFSTAIQDEQSFSLINFCKKGRIPLPPKSLQNIILGDIRFEVVWSGPNNKLYFLYNAFEPQTGLDELRNVEHWAQTRERAGHLYDRTLYAVCNTIKNFEHLNKENRDKIKPLDAAGWSEDPGKLRDVLQKCFTSMQDIHPFQPKKRKAHSVPDDTLITMVGNDPQPTLVAIATHREKHILLGYTQRTQSIATKLQQLSTIMGSHEVELFPCDPTGSDIPASLAVPEHPETVAVHISPGTKGQGAFLVLWAKQQHCQAWTFNTQKAISERLDAEAHPLSMMAADSVESLRAQGKEVHYADEGDPEAQKKHQHQCDALLNFLGQAMKTKFDFSQAIRLGRRFPSFSARSMTLSTPKPKEWILKDKTGTLCRFSEKGGEWLEYLAARAFERAGARQVYTRVRIEWSEKNKDFLSKKYPGEKDFFVRDMDVLGSYGSRNFLVSCKAKTDSVTIEESAGEAALMAPLIGRYTLPLLCHLGCDKSYIFEDAERKQKVRVIGWRELCCPEKLRHYLDELRELIY